ncbi:MAG: 2-oxoacid:ferredoxin oxidoreductase subunit beta [Ignavibacteriae bacterium]|nr:MAG: 2-oxoacid:ferredoxin oxidoreductase subunit beta [Ignavibacteriota bacterium]
MSALIQEIPVKSVASPSQTFTAKDMQSDQEVRWCPGCGDYSILAQAQRIMPDLGIPKHKIVFVSGIGCSSRFPYYMNTYGFHSIHGRATAIASGVKLTQPDLSVWVVTGDGDGMSIGGNHLIHLLRRNIDVNVLLFNNQIYGLTKGQYSPTSEKGKVTKSTPFGSLDYPFNPIALALGAGATFAARTLDRDQKHLQMTLKRAAAHVGTSFIEIYQNCSVFNDGTFEQFTDKGVKDDNIILLDHGKPLIFGREKDKGIHMNGFTPEVVSLKDGHYSVNDLLVHNENDTTLSFILADMTYHPPLPRPIGVFLSMDRPTYETEMVHQIEASKKKLGDGDIKSLLNSGDTWTIQ